MFKQSNNNIIQITRGDNGFITFLLPDVDNTNLYPHGRELASNEELYFGLTEPNQPFEFAILKKKFSSEHPPIYVEPEAIGTCFCNEIIKVPSVGILCQIPLYPDDTVCLLPGKYFYTIKLKTNLLTNNLDKNNYTVQTLIDKAEFYIL